MSVTLNIAYVHTDVYVYMFIDICMCTSYSSQESVGHIYNHKWFLQQVRDRRYYLFVYVETELKKIFLASKGKLFMFYYRLITEEIKSIYTQLTKTPLLLEATPFGCFLFYFSTQNKRPPLSVTNIQREQTKYHIMSLKCTDELYIHTYILMVLDAVVK